MITQQAILYFILFLWTSWIPAAVSLGIGVIFAFHSTGFNFVSLQPGSRIAAHIEGVMAAGDDGDLQKKVIWPVPRLIDNGDGRVTDKLSGLMWTRNADKANGTADWEQAVAGARECGDGGFSDWRLINRNELASLIDLGRFNPDLPEGHPFTGVQPSYYWTSTTFANNGDHAWMIHFFTGFITHDDKGGTHYVWYVR